MKREILPVEASTKQVLKILLVEDDKIIQKVHQIFLEQLGYEVDAVGTGCKALDCLKSREYDAMVLDIGLPDVSGEFVLISTRLREFSTKKRLPILINTAHTSEETLAYFCKVGADAVFNKPISKEQFRRALETMLAYSPEKR